MTIKMLYNIYNWDGTTTENKLTKSMAAKSDWASSDVSGSPGSTMEINNYIFYKKEAQCKT